MSTLAEYEQHISDMAALHPDLSFKYVRQAVSYGLSDDVTHELLEVCEKVAQSFDLLPSFAAVVAVYRYENFLPPIRWWTRWWVKAKRFLR